ncbi:hypothetical protein DNK55_25020 [Streptomyces sp. AC1-42T]|nr:hypothetical protein DNK55_25020 [Streptomyces sp. AC1-42T]
MSRRGGAPGRARVRPGRRPRARRSRPPRRPRGRRAACRRRAPCGRRRPLLDVPLPLAPAHCRSCPVRAAPGGPPSIIGTAGTVRLSGSCRRPR